MKAVSFARFTSALAGLLLVVAVPAALAQARGNCAEIANDVGVAVSKDPSKVLMVVEDALVINESCAGEIVKAAIIASKADNALANQIVQTAVTVAPKMTVAINDAAATVIPGLVAVAPTEVQPQGDISPYTGDDKNPGKNPVKNPIVVEPTPVVEEDFFIPASIRGIYLIQPPASGPLSCDDTKRCLCTPVSPAVALP